MITRLNAAILATSESIMKTKSQQSPWLYIPLWLFFVYLFFQILGFQSSTNTNPILAGMYFVEFGVHEASHIVLMFLPSIMTAAAGSIGEITFTILIVVAAFKGKAFFAAVFGMLWVMLAMNSTGYYMADARTQALPLIGPSDQPIHDWNFVFGQLGWLQADMAIGNTVRVVGDIIGAVALLYGFMLILSMVMNRQSSTVKQTKLPPIT